MFDKLRHAFSSVEKSLAQREIGEKNIKDVLFDLEISLLESDVATEVVDAIKSDLKKDLLGTRVEKGLIGKFVKDSLVSSISGLFDGAGRIDLVGMIAEKKKKGSPFLILFVGINGTGKTTTLAKIAHMLQQEKFSVVVAAGDTFRAGAIEQLREHTNRLNLKLVAQNYDSDPAAVARDAVLYAKSHKTDCVLIDTAGRMQTSTNLMEQIAKITKVVGPDLKIFVGDSLAGNDTVSQAREFYEHVKFDCSILTKSDADARGGAALSIAKVTSTPILYLGVGQEYGDLKPFDKNAFLETVFGTPTDAGMRDGQRQEMLPKRQDAPPETRHGTPAEEESPGEAPPDRGDAQDASAGTKQDVHGDDPLAGISDDDIAAYSDLFDVRPPGSDSEASELAKDIRQWISGGRKDPRKHGGGPEPAGAGEPEERDGEGTHKKRGRFGFFRK